MIWFILSIWLVCGVIGSVGLAYYTLIIKKEDLKIEDTYLLLLIFLTGIVGLITIVAMSLTDWYMANKNKIIIKAPNR